MNHPIPTNLIEAVGNDWDLKIDALRDELLKRQAEAYKHTNVAFGRNLAHLLNDRSNEVEIARRIFNTYLATGEVIFPS
jgi:hypothetical protein